MHQHRRFHFFNIYTFAMILLLLAVVCEMLATAYTFDQKSCDSLLPKSPEYRIGGPEKDPIYNPHDPGILSDHEDSEMNEDEFDKDGYDDNGEEELLPALEANPYKITTSSAKYRRGREIEVVVEGPDFSGIILQARQLDSEHSAPVGVFTSVPGVMTTIGCGRRSTPNTAISRDTTGKSRVQLTWRAPLEDSGPIYFKATIVRQSYYWVDTKSVPLPFNHFPPSVKSCGFDKSCYRYSSLPHECTPETCDYIVIAKLVANDVHFTIGGKLKENDGYVGIGFTSDTEKLRKMDVCACVKTGSVIDPAHYHVEDISQVPIKSNEILIDEEFDIDGSTIWCHFRRPLKVPGEEAANLREPLYQVFLWGPLNTNGIPVLQPADEIVHLSEPWMYNQTINMYHVVGSGATYISNILLLILAALILNLVLLS